MGVTDAAARWPHAHGIRVLGAHAHDAVHKRDAHLQQHDTANILNLDLCKGIRLTLTGATALPVRRAMRKRPNTARMMRSTTKSKEAIPARAPLSCRAKFRSMAMATSQMSGWTISLRKRATSRFAQCGHGETGQAHRITSLLYPFPPRPYWGAAALASAEQKRDSARDAPKAA